METQMKNRIKTKETGSFFNLMMGNNQTLPKVGQGATILHWTDRSAYEVLEVSSDYKRIVIQRYEPSRKDNNGMSESQDYEYKNLVGGTIVLVWRNNQWKIENEVIHFCSKWVSQLPENTSYYKFLTDEQREFIYNGEVHPQRVLEGITKLKKVYSKVNIIWGVKREYYDYSF